MEGVADSQAGPDQPKSVHWRAYLPGFVALVVAIGLGYLLPPVTEYGRDFDRSLRLLGGQVSLVDLVWLLATLVLCIVIIWGRVRIGRLLGQTVGAMLAGVKRDTVPSSRRDGRELPRLGASLALGLFNLALVLIVQSLLRPPLVTVGAAYARKSYVDAGIVVLVFLVALLMLLRLYAASRPLIEQLVWAGLEQVVPTAGYETPKTAPAIPRPAASAAVTPARSRPAEATVAAQNAGAAEAMAVAAEVTLAASPPAAAAEATMAAPSVVSAEETLAEPSPAADVALGSASPSPEDGLVHLELPPAAAADWQIDATIAGPSGSRSVEAEPLVEEPPPVEAGSVADEPQPVEAPGGPAQEPELTPAGGEMAAISAPVLDQQEETPVPALDQQDETPAPPLEAQLEPEHPKSVAVEPESALDRPPTELDQIAVAAPEQGNRSHTQWSKLRFGTGMPAGTPPVVAPIGTKPPVNAEEKPAERTTWSEVTFARRTTSPATPATPELRLSGEAERTVSASPSEMDQTVVHDECEPGSDTTQNGG